MTLHTTLRAAEEIGVNPRHAVLMRLKFLNSEIQELEGEIRYCEYLKRKNSKWLRQSGEVFGVIYLQQLEPLRSEQRSLLDFLNGKFKAKAGTEITDSMIERARNYPLATLIGQTPKGASQVVCCPFHTDKGPSASVKHNVLTCFAGCRPKKEGRKGWDPILYLMEKEGKSFREAVLALQ